MQTATVEIELGKTYERWGVRITPLDPTMIGVRLKLDKVPKRRIKRKIDKPNPKG